MNKPKIIYFIDDTPPYDAYIGHARPKYNWDTPSGDWVGIWGFDWADIIGENILALTRDYEFEVWQPDYRADKIYEQVLGNGTKHRLFPAKEIKVFHTYKFDNEWYSHEMLQEFETLNSNGIKTVIAKRLEPTKFNSDLLKQSKNKYPVMGNSLGALDLLFFMYAHEKFHKKILKRIRYEMDLRFLRKFRYLFLIDLFPEWKYKKVQDLFPKSKILKWFMGLPDEYLLTENPDKKILRREFGLPVNSTIFFSASRLNSLKQIDRIIECFAPIKDKDFFVIISGSGNTGYIEYLQNLIKQHHLSEKIKIFGFVPDEDIVKFHQLADCFIDASQLDGAPTGGWKSIALGVPVLTTATGNVGEYLKKTSSGDVLELGNYNQWTKQFSDFIDTGNLKICDQKEAHKILNWTYCANRFLDGFKAVLDDFYKQN
jgi:glycosyltransferase involved in cell wall biosynthesis